MDFGDFGKAFTGGGDNFVNTLGGFTSKTLEKSPIPIPNTIPSGVQNFINQTPAGQYLGGTMASFDLRKQSTAIRVGLNKGKELGQQALNDLGLEKNMCNCLLWIYHLIF